MPSSTIVSALAAALLCFDSAAALVAKRSISAPSFTASYTGLANDTSFPAVHRDGGGGGIVNNKAIIVFSDTTTIDKSFSSNSYAEVIAQIPNFPTKQC